MNDVINKIFCIGYPKTGSTSLCEYLNSCGYKILHDEHEIFKTMYIDGVIRDELDNCDGISNMAVKFFRDYDIRYPNSKFILTVRDAKSWWKSISAWRHKEPSSIKTTEIYNIHYRALFNCTFPNMNQAIYSMTLHTQIVSDYFKYREDDLLLLDVNDNNKAQKINKFLNIDSNTKYPYHNVQFNTYKG